MENWMWASGQLAAAIMRKGYVDEYFVMALGELAQQGNCEKIAMVIESELEANPWLEFFLASKIAPWRSRKFEERNGDAADFITGILQYQHLHPPFEDIIPVADAYKIWRKAKSSIYRSPHLYWGEVDKVTKCVTVRAMHRKEGMPILKTYNVLYRFNLFVDDDFVEVDIILPVQAYNESSALVAAENEAITLVYEKATFRILRKGKMEQLPVNTQFKLLTNEKRNEMSPRAIVKDEHFENVGIDEIIERLTHDSSISEAAIVIDVSAAAD